MKYLLADVTLSHLGKSISYLELILDLPLSDKNSKTGTRIHPVLTVDDLASVIHAFVTFQLDYSNAISWA